MTRQHGRGHPARTTAAAAALAVLVGGALPAAGQAAGDSGWRTVDGDSQHSRQGDGLGPVDPEVNWVWDDDTYAADGSIGSTWVNVPGVVDHDGRLLFKTRNTAFDHLDDQPKRYDLLALDPGDGSHETLLADVHGDYCVPAVAPDGTIWTFQARNTRTESHGFDDRAAAALVGIDPDTGDIVHRYSGPGGDSPGVYGCEQGIEFGPDGTVLFKDYPTPGGNKDGDFSPWLHAVGPDGNLKWAEYYALDDTQRKYSYPWTLVAPAGTPGEGVAYVGYRAVGEDYIAGLAAIDLDTGDVARSLALPGTNFETSPVVDPDGGIVISLQDGRDAGHLLRVVDDGNDLDIDWRQEFSDESSRPGALQSIPSSLQVAGERLVGWSDDGNNVYSIRWDDGSFLWSTRVGFRETDKVAVDAAGYAYVSRLTGGGDDNLALEVISPSGARTGRLLKGAVAEASDGESYGFNVVGPLTGDGTLYLWSAKNAWVSVSGADTSRIAGGTRYETAAEIATSRFPTGVDRAYLAVGTNYPDALTGGPLAALGQDPILLTDPGILPGETAAALERLRPAEVVALGGTGALSDEVLAAAGEAADATTGRISGGTRYGTAAEIARHMPTTDTVYLAVGTNYPDALSGGPATDGAPILLTGTTTLPAETIEVLDERRPERVVALGGPVAITQDVLDQAAAAAGGADASRLAGGTRYATAVEVADDVVAGDDFTGTVYVAVGTNYPDALSAASAAQIDGAPMVLTDSTHLPAEVQEWLGELEGLERIVILGGPTAVSAEVAAELDALVD